MERTAVVGLIAYHRRPRVSVLQTESSVTDRQQRRERHYILPQQKRSYYCNPCQKPQYSTNAPIRDKLKSRLWGY